MVRDPEFGPLRLRAFGTYALRAVDPRALLQGLVGTDQAFETDEIGELLRSLINTAFAQLLGESRIAALDLAANLASLSDTLRKRVQLQIDDEYGLELPQLLIVNVSLPPEVEKALDTRTSMGVIGDLQRFQQFQAGNAVLASAQNPAGGLAAAGAGIGLAAAMAAQVGQSLAPPAPGGPPPPPAAWHVTQGGRTMGPFDVAALAGAAARGELTAASMVWTPGMSGWMAAAQVPALAQLFAASPPPPPPPPPPGK